jgi:hypothetical protein
MLTFLSERFKQELKKDNGEEKEEGLPRSRQRDRGNQRLRTAAVGNGNAGAAGGNAGAAGGNGGNADEVEVEFQVEVEVEVEDEEAMTAMLQRLTHIYYVYVVLFADRPGVIKIGISYSSLTTTHSR